MKWTEANQNVSLFAPEWVSYNLHPQEGKHNDCVNNAQIFMKFVKPQLRTSATKHEHTSVLFLTIHGAKSER